MAYETRLSGPVTSSTAESIDAECRDVCQATYDACYQAAETADNTGACIDAQIACNSGNDEAWYDTNVADVAQFRTCCATSLTDDAICPMLLLSPDPPGNTPPSNLDAVQQCNLDYVGGSCPVTQSQDCLADHMQLVQTAPPTSNGCGTEPQDYVQMLVREGLTEYAQLFQGCCNSHDLCFRTCSLGDDSQFDMCNSDFKQCMFNLCSFYSESLLNLGSYAVCAAKAEGIYLAVQLQGCGPYQDAQREACCCVACDDSEDTDPSKIVLQNPTVDAIGFSCCKHGLGRGEADGSTSSWILCRGGGHQQFVNQQSATVAVRHMSAEYPKISGSTSRRQNIELSSYFTSIGDTDPGRYSCGTAGAQLCTIADALIGMAAVARGIESYTSGSFQPTRNSNTSASSSSTASSSTTSLTSTSVEVDSYSSASNSEITTSSVPLANYGVFDNNGHKDSLNAYITVSPDHIVSHIVSHIDVFSYLYLCLSQLLLGGLQYFIQPFHGREQDVQVKCYHVSLTYQDFNVKNPNQHLDCHSAIAVNGSRTASLRRRCVDIRR